MDDHPQTALVIPFYNELHRLDWVQLRRLADRPGLGLTLVDDGSQDGTGTALARFLEELAGPHQLLLLERNVGKGEAVRRGLTASLRPGVEFVGFADADFATPFEEIVRLQEIIRSDQRLDVLLAARVQLADRLIRRRAARHYVGRIIATYIDLILKSHVYDTQCGCKFFRVTPVLESVLADPFKTRWLFDVELLKRLAEHHASRGTQLRMREEPLEVWIDVGGSKILGGREMLRVVRDLGVLAFRA